jgi:diguanylate cyclase (GGDEF)-like protein/PAS domain S-box-containing protein
MLGPFLDLFILDDDVAALEGELAARQGDARLAALVPLAWHLRQRDCARALQLADEVEERLSSLRNGGVERSRKLARMQLVRAEVMALFADLDGALKQVTSAVESFERLQDPLGAGDGCWLLSVIWQDRGNRQQLAASLDQALAHYRAAGDPLRVEIVAARSLAQTAFADPAAAAAGLAKAFSEADSHHMLVNTWIMMAQGHVAALTDDPGVAIKYDLQCYRNTRDTGQIRQAMVCATNAGEGLATLGDLDAALEWSERGLAMARGTGWPGSMGVCLKQMGDVLRQLGRFDEARAFLREALQVMQALAGSRNQEQVMGSLGELAVAMGAYDEALGWFVQLEHGLSARNEPDLQMKARRGQATCLCRMGRPAEAARKLTQALELARDKGNSDEQIKALQVFAELHRDHALSAPPGMAAATATLHYLQQALKLADSVSGYALPVELLNQVAGAYAASGDYRSAYEYGLKATAARNQARVEEAQKRALALQIRHEIERAQADSDQHKRMAATLQEANATLETLGQIGREITGSLEANAVFDALLRHVSRLLDADSFVIYLLDASGQTLSTAFGIDGGRPHPMIARAVGHPTSNISRCARERREIVIDKSEGDVDTTTIPGTVPTMSMLFAPLEVGKRLLGVMTIQSQRPKAYGERECSIFRTLCAYGAIALDNAAAYGAVEAARRKTEGQEQELRIAAAAFESQQGMFITDADQTILRVNRAFTHITGFSGPEVIGRKPGMFRTPQQDDDFYETIAESARTKGSWEGEIWTRRKGGDSLPLWLSVTAVKAEAGAVTHYVVALVDITERKLAEDEIRNLAFYDPLTNLPNRRLLMDRLRHALATSARTSSTGGLLFIDLDNFKKLNDTRGHDVGDLLLGQVARRISSCLREADTVARLGGDEFVVLLEGLGPHALEAAEKIEVLASKILTVLNQPYLLDGKEHHSTPSIGVCLFRGQEMPVDELLKHADLAMYQAKAAGRNAVRFFDPAMQAAVTAHAALESDLRHALTHNQFVLHFQAQVDAGGNMVGAEALVRWRHPSRGMVAPGEFIPLAEETGLIVPLGHWVLEAACLQLRRWAEHPPAAHLTLAVNISARQFHDAGFVDNVLTVLERTGVDPRKLKLELTETLLVKDVDWIITKMNALIPTGLRFSLDDFGTGYSSLAYLKRLPLEQLKVDQSFVRDIFVDANDLAIVRAIVTLGHSLGLSVVAEGVETEEQRKFLLETGCHAFQGYLFGRPVPAEALLERLREPA